MALTKEEKLEIIGRYGLNQKDNGSPEVQIGIITEEIERIFKHLKDYKRDNDSRRGLLHKVSKRRLLLMYLRHYYPDRYKRYNKITQEVSMEK